MGGHSCNTGLQTHIAVTQEKGRDHETLTTLREEGKKHTVISKEIPRTFIRV